MKKPVAPLRDLTEANTRAIGRLVEQTMERRHELLIVWATLMLSVGLHVVTIVLLIVL